jgi:hypothetical protein
MSEFAVPKAPETSRMARLMQILQLGGFMKKFLTATALILGLAAADGMSTVAAQAQADGKKFDKGSTVTLQGCVVMAEKKDTFILTNVREWPLSTSDMGKFGKRMYWIEKTDKMRGHVGHTIQLVGKITDVEKSEMELKAGESGNGFNVEIEGPGRDVVAPAGNAGVVSEGRPNADDIPITLLKMKIDDIKMVSAKCDSTL